MNERMAEVGARLRKLDIDIELTELSISEVSTKSMASRMLVESVASPTDKASLGFDILAAMLTGQKTPELGDNDRDSAAQLMGELWGLAGHIAGRYLPESQEILINSGLHDESQTIDHTIAHELGHAHHDQIVRRLARQSAAEGKADWFNFDQFPQQTDLRLSALMISEGYAELIGLSYSRGIHGLDLTSLQPSLFFSDPALDLEPSSQPAHYRLGTGFAIAQLQASGWQGLRATVAKAPVSSEQIMHPEKYGVDLPTAIPKDTVLRRAGYEQVDEDVIGELGIRGLMRASGLSGDVARGVAAGWDGDALRIYRKRDQILLLWRTVWDRNADAQQFHQRLKANERLPDSVYIRRRRHVVDFAYASGKTGRKQLYRKLKRLPKIATPSRSDQTLSEAADRQHAADLRAGPELEGHTLHFRDLALSLNIEGWRPQLEEIPVWLSRDGDLERGIVTVQWLANAEATPLDLVAAQIREGIGLGSGQSLVSSRQFEFFGRPSYEFLWREPGDGQFSGREHQQVDLLFCQADRIAWISLRGPSSNFAELRSDFARMLQLEQASKAP